MADTQVIEFATFALPADAATAFQDRAAAASKAGGLVQQHAGSKVEDPTSGVHVTVWSSAAAQAAWAATPTTVDGKPPVVVEVVGGGAKSHGTPLDAIGAPTTEIFTGYGADPAVFPAAVRTFRDRMNEPAVRPEGYVASGVVDTAVDVKPSGAGADPKWAGPATKLIIGWTSVEAHQAAKAKPEPILSNIDLLRTGLTAGSMYHVHFQKL